jgi:hypothetical protein
VQLFYPREDAQRRLSSVEEAEADCHDYLRKVLTSTTDVRKAEALRKTFGLQHEQWEAFKSQIQPGDELWEFCSAQATWSARMGRAGYELLRDGVVIAEIITSRSLRPGEQRDNPPMHRTGPAV